MDNSSEIKPQINEEDDEPFPVLTQEQIVTYQKSHSHCYRIV